ncbi:MAG TPA: glycosyltransferase family 4 protein [Steroidobacteraceae bacterium]|nr:glycosyltransferase family 4 protein [Steroidobacteraceae bacterium]
MRIAQVAPLVEAVPPKLYGGTERIVSYLTEELVRSGHQVTLFASGDSETSAELVACRERALRLDAGVLDPLPHLLVMLAEVHSRAAEFDVLHFHVDLLHFPIFRDLAARTLTTLHGRVDLPDLPPLYQHFPQFPLVSISDDQRRPLASANWIGTVYHGLPQDLLDFTARPRENYLAFLGRMSPEKRPDRAIEIARRTGLPLRIAAKVDHADREYFERTVAPLLDHPLVEYIGEIGETEKSAFLGNARALLFPVDWPEPFGLVIIESMACGTPVIAFPCGSVPEVIEDGVTGFIVESVEEAVGAVGRLDRLDRRTIRASFEREFSAERMARDYEALYAKIARATTPKLRVA